VGAFILADRLVVVGGGGVEGSAESDKERFPEGGDEGVALVG
jgi:hypothetical protein